MIISPNDYKKYQTFQLANGLRVLSIEDHTSDKSAVSLTVNCGHFDDPRERQGMAHFLEHMLFLGTKSNPNPGDYSQYISSHGGSNNAWTGTEFTTYFFDINREYLEPALTHFSQFFSEPLLCKDYIEKERNAVDAEYKLKLKEDTHRIYQVHKESINQEHPFSKFSVGNTETLADRDGVSIRQELVDFHAKYYVPEHMALVVLCAKPLDEQKQIIEQLFGQLEKKAGPNRQITTPIYTEAHSQLEISIKPHKESNKLVASYAMPSTDKYYVNKTMNYVAHLIGHEGPGSILSLLKTQGWCNGLSAGRGVSGSNFKDFNVSFDLTEAGINHCDEIISLLYQYIYMMKQCDHHPALYADKKKLLQLAFDYQEKTKAINYVSHLSVNMFHYRSEHYLYGDYIMEGFSQAEFDEICQLLSPDNLRLIHINPEVETDRKANWYHTPYKLAKIAPERLAKFKAINHCDSRLALPQINPYLTNEIVLQPKPTGEPIEVPKIIHQSDSYNFWFMQDTQFNVPKGHCYIAMDCPISTQSIQNIAITRLFNELFLDAVIEDHYAAELAGLSYHIYVHQGGLTVHTSGISTNQHLLIEKLLVNLHEIKFTEVRFEQIKKQLVTHWLNSAKSKPVSQLFSLLTATLQPNNPTMRQLAGALEPVDFAQFSEVQAGLFTQIHIDAFAFGNWTYDQAMSLTNKIKELVLDKTEPHPEVFRPVMSLQHHHHVAIEKQLDQYDNAIVLYYQSPDNDPQSSAKYIMLNHVIGPEFFHHLRTEKQLGYLVGTGFVPLNKYPGIATYIQSPNVDAGTLYQEIQKFYQQFCDEVIGIELEQWRKFQYGLMVQVLEKDRNLRILSQRFWGCIGNKDITFDEREQIAYYIQQLTPKDLHDFAKSILLDNSDGKLAILTGAHENSIEPLQLLDIEQLQANLSPLNNG